MNPTLSDEIWVLDKGHTHGEASLMVKDVKNSIKKLKADCLFCGKKVGTGRGRPNISGVCDGCRSCFKNYSITGLKQRLNAKIDRIFGPKLVK